MKFDDNFRVGEDTVFVLEYLKCISSVKILDTSYYRYTVNTNNKKYQVNINTQLQLVKKLYSLYNDLNLNNRKLLEKIYSQVGNIKDFNLHSIHYKWFTDDTIIELLRELYYKDGTINQLRYLKLKLMSYTKYLPYEIARYLYQL